MVLLILAAVWALVLIPPLFRGRVESRSADSIGDFRRQLHVLRRTGPTSITPAHSARFGAMPVGSMVAPYRAPGAPRSPQAFRRQRTLRRRRDVLLALMGGTVASLLLGAIPALRMLWLVTLASSALLVAYVAMLVRMRNLAAERDMKLRFLPAAASGADPALLLHRSAN